METRTITYNAFDFGEFGTMAPEKAPPGSWTGNNVVVYRDGCIGPRPGVKKAVRSTEIGSAALRGLAFTPLASAGDKPLLIIQDSTTIKCCDPDDAYPPTVSNVSGTLSAVAGTSDTDRVLGVESVRQLNGKLYFPNNGDRLYAYNGASASKSVASVSTVPEGNTIAMFRDRVYVGNGATRVYYSAAGNETSWTAGNYFDVGVSWAIYAMEQFRDSLLIFTQWGTWMLTGASPVTGTLRRISDTFSPLAKSVVAGNDELFYIPSSRNAPVIFQGSYGDEATLKHLENWKSDNDSAYGAQSYANRDILWSSSSGTLLWRKNNAWSQHTFNRSPFSVSLGPWIVRFRDTRILLGTNGSSPDLYWLDMDLDRPAFTSDTYAQPGDDSTTPMTDCYFTIPTIYAPEGYRCRVRRIAVDFQKYDTGSATANNIDVTVTQFGDINESGEDTETQTLYNEAGSGIAGTTSGTPSRLAANFGTNGWHGAFSVKLSALKGVKIRSISIDYETEKPTTIRS